MGWNRVAIVGAGLINFGELFDKSWDTMVQEAFLNAVSSVDKGFDPSEIQAGWLGNCMPNLWGEAVPSGSSLMGTIGLGGVSCTRVEGGCPTGGIAFCNACLGVASGVYDVALVLGFEKMRDSTTAKLLSVAMGGHPFLQFGETAMTGFAPQALRHMHEFGTTKEQMAMVAVKNRRHGGLDPYSHYQTPITIEDVLKSPVVCWPFNLLDCCPQTDGAAAVILCRADLASKYTDRPVYVAGFGIATDAPYMYQKPSLVEYPATIKAAQQAYKMAGIGPQDIDVAELHDCFSSQEIIDYEDVGFCERGQGGKLIESGATTIGGRIPVNPSGGLMSKGHPLGATGVGQIVELYWQLRGDAAKQNEKRQVEIKKGYAMQHNVGGKGASNSAVTILTSRR